MRYLVIFALLLLSCSPPSFKEIQEKARAFEINYPECSITFPKDALGNTTMACVIKGKKFPNFEREKCTVLFYAAAMRREVFGGRKLYEITIRFPDNKPTYIPGENQEKIKYSSDDTDCP